MRRLAAALFVAFSSFSAAFGQCVLSFDAPRSGGPPLLHLTASRFDDDGTFLFEFPPNLDIAPLGTADFDGNGAPDAPLGNSIYLDFRFPVALPLDASETLLHVADVNRDGRPDLIAASSTQLVTLLNSGGATFTRKITPNVFQARVPIDVFADFNGDGLVDVYVWGYPVFLGVGDGTFKPEDGPVAISNDSGHWVAADVNGDHLPDIVAVNGTSLTVFRRLAKGFGPGEVATFASSAALLAVADFDRNGSDDFLFANGTLMFNAGGNNSQVQTTGLGFSADFNGDGAPDLLDRTADGFRIHINDGHGNLQLREELRGMPPIVVLDTIGPPGVTTVSSMPLAVDMDGDGILDLVVSRAADHYVLQGNGDGTFRVPRVAFAKADSGAAGDFDGDGDDDVAMPFAIAWNNGDNTFHIAPLSDQRLFRILRAADVDGDGKAEVITATDGLQVLALRPDGSISEVARLPLSVVDAAVGDFSGTHHAQLAVIVETPVGRRLHVVEIRTGAAPRWTASFDGEARSIAAADLDGDGADDGVVAGGTINPPQWNRPRGSRDGFLSIFRSTRDSFEAERRTTSDNAALDEVTTGDFNGDGKVDVAVAALFDARIIALYGDGAGGFARHQNLALVSQEDDFNLRAADFDGDGVTDLALNGAWRVYRGGASGLTEQDGYFGPQDVSWTLDYKPKASYFPFVVRRRGALPSIVVALRDSAQAFVYRPTCGRPRAVRH